MKVFLGSAVFKVTFGDFSYQQKCPDITSVNYSSYLSSGAPLPDFIDFNSLSRTFSIDPSQIVSASTFKITVNGTVKNL